MRRSRKLLRKIISIAIAATLLTGLAPAGTHAETTSEKIKKAEQLKKVTEEQKKAVDSKKEDLEDTKQQLQDYLNKLNSELEEISNNLAEIETRMSEKQTEIVHAKLDIEAAKIEEARQYELMKKRLRVIYEKGDVSLLQTFMQTTNYSDFLNKAEYVGRLEEYDRKMFDGLVQQRKLVEEKEEVLKIEIEQLDELMGDAKAEKNKVSTLVNSTSGTIAATDGAISAAELEQRAYESEIKEQEANLTALKKQLEEEKALSERANRMAWSNASDLGFEGSDRELLACLIYCEAGNQPYIGQVAVGSVVVNRMRSAAFPNTMVGVIYQKRQFSPVGSGRLATRLSLGATESCYRAADEAMAGVQPVGNCLFFRTVIPQIKGTIIGGHVFY
ncbi:MAG: cell wall hydrolase [Lachnospiraceae bacterium]|nr:cell wall hydrolase [Lachnospiraceae bacterium]